MQFSSEVFPGHGAGESLGSTQFLMDCPWCVCGGGSPRFTTASAVSTENEVFRELTSDGRKQPSRGTGKPLAEAT